MRPTLRLALAQTTSAAAHGPNIAALRRHAAEAAAEGCELLALPEVSGLMCRDPAAARAQVVEEARDPYLAAAREAAAAQGLWIHTGSTPVLGPDGRFLNRAHLIDPSGAVVARYDKIHLFDVFLEDGESRLESKRFAPGAEAALAETPWGPWGLSICYDLRFPALYRAYGEAGATVIFVPSAFTRPTGAAHWETLLRARAIETGAFVVAPAQTGRHEDGRETWGRSMVVGPWGEVLADLGEAPGAATVTLELAEAARARRRIPSLKNARPFTLNRAGAAEVETG